MSKHILNELPSVTFFAIAAVTVIVARFYLFA